MPALGLKFSRLEAIPAAGDRTTAHIQAFTDAGCTVNLEANVSIMKSPVGDVSFCEREVTKRVDKALHILDSIAKLPDQHCAFYLMRSEIGCMDYTIRTTPKGSCTAALQK